MQLRRLQHHTPYLQFAPQHLCGQCAKSLSRQKKSYYLLHGCASRTLFHAVQLVCCMDLLSDGVGGQGEELGPAHQSPHGQKSEGGDDTLPGLSMSLSWVLCLSASQVWLDTTPSAGHTFCPVRFTLCCTVAYIAMTIEMQQWCPAGSVEMLQVALHMHSSSQGLLQSFLHCIAILHLMQHTSHA